MKLISFNELAPESLDRKAGIVYGVAVCTEGPARGHGLTVDHVTLQQLLVSAESKGKVPTKLDHKTGIGAVCGYLTDFWIEGDKLRANWQLLKNQPNFSHTWELIENLHDTCGLSCSFTGEAEDGHARCKELISCDFVPHPATGNGLFSRGEDEEENEEPMDNEPMSVEEMLEQILANQEELLDRLETVEARQDELSDALEALQGTEEDDDDDVEDDEAEPVLDERGAYGTHDHAAALETFDLNSRVHELQLAGKSPKEAHILALKEFARETFRLENV